MDDVVREAKFDPKVRAYWFWQGAWVHLLLVTALIGVVTFPVWMFGFGTWIVRRRYSHLSATLTRKELHLRTGGLVRVEKTVPLEQIQDLAIRTGPLLDRLGLASVHVETAGQSGQGNADMTLPGIVDARGFRDAVLAQREALLERRRGPEPAAADADEVLVTLREIRDVLVRLEARLPE